MKINKRLFAVMLAFVTVATSFAQFTNCKVADIEKFKQSGTVVVAISDDDATNKIAEEVMASYWKAGKYKVIKESELEAYVKANLENYVLTYVLNNKTHVIAIPNGPIGPRNKTRTTIIGDGLMLSKNVKKVKKLKPTDAMIYTFIDPDMDMIEEKAEFIRQVGSINAILMYPGLKDNQIGGWKIPTINQKEILKKELWIAEEDLNKKGEDAAKMAATYKPYKYKIVSKMEIAKAIYEKKKDVVYLSRPEYQVGAFMFMVHSTEDNSALFFLGGTAGFGYKDLEKIKNNKQYGQ